MLAVLIVGVGWGVLATSLSLDTELSSLVRLLDGERGAVALLGFCCVVKRSLIVLAACFRFLSPELEDIWVRTRKWRGWACSKWVVELAAMSGGPG